MLLSFKELTADAAGHVNTRNTNLRKLGQSMSITKERAISIAKKFAESEYRNTEFPLRLGDAQARLERGGFGHNVLGLGLSYWSIVFDLVNLDSNVAVMDPDHLIVLVDAESEKPVWFPLM